MACVTVSLDIKTRLHAQAESVLYLLITVSSWNVTGSNSDSSSSGSSSKEVVIIIFDFGYFTDVISRHNGYMYFIYFDENLFSPSLYLDQVVITEAKTNFICCYRFKSNSLRIKQTCCFRWPRWHQAYSSALSKPAVISVVAQHL